MSPGTLYLKLLKLLGPLSFIKSYFLVLLILIGIFKYLNNNSV